MKAFKELFHQKDIYLHYKTAKRNNLRE